jgi:hypothetical protein
MKRPRYPVLVGIFCLVAGTACSENPSDLKTLANHRASLVVTSALSLDGNIVQLIALFPTDLGARNEQRSQQGQNEDLNPVATWTIIKQKYAAAASKPAKIAAVKKLLVRISDWVTKNAQEMNPPPGSETKTAAAARLVLYMNMYVYGGPGTLPPSYLPDADVAVGVVTPNDAATIVTPTGHAGVQFRAGSVAENTVIVVTQNATLYRPECSGPLKTNFCQYPQFYTFDAFPDNGLILPAIVNVCHVRGEGTRSPLVDHDRLRLAHPKPANPANYVTGGKVFDQNGDSIEVLPLVSQSFSTCVGSSYPIVGFGPAAVLSRLARSIGNILTPNPVYAIDLGLGGLVKRFSPFNDVDTLGRPDLVVQTFALPGLTPVEGDPSVRPGSHVAVSYTVRNIGKATARSVPARIELTTSGAEPIVQLLRTVTIPALPPGSSETQSSIDAVVPWQTASRTYAVGLVLGADPGFPDPVPTNNRLSTPLNVAGPISCSAEGTIRSTSFANPSVMRIQNGSSEALTIYWLDYNGARVGYSVLQPGQLFGINSYLTHPWLVIGASGRCYGIFLPSGTITPVVTVQ